nr:hypothetical protein [Tanacetum cinerariifolium]
EEVQVPAHDDVDQENVIEEIADDVAQPTLPLPPSPVISSLPPHQSPRTSPSQAAEGSSILVHKGILVEDPKPMKKKDQITMDAQYARKLQEEEESHAQAKDVQAKGI